jgi:hypothetical protein
MPKSQEDAAEHHGVLSRGYRRMIVCREIADGKSISWLIEKYGVTKVAVLAFKRNNAELIGKLRAQVEDELVGLWIADKALRVAEYQQAAEDLDDALQSVMRNGTVLGKDDVALLTEKRKTFRAVAEELGQLPNRNQIDVQGASVTYNFEGVDPNALK